MRRKFVHNHLDMTSLLADAHAHLDEPQLRDQKEAVLRRAREAGVRLIVNVGIGRENSRRVVETAERYPEVFATVGVHPHGVAVLTPRDLEVLTPVASHPKVVAVGEIGLDFYRRRSPEKVQEHWFREQLAWAHELGKIVVIHTRDATDATLKVLREDRRHLRGGIMHCFLGDLEEARAFLDLGFYLSFSGVLTFPKAEPLRQMVRQLPRDRLLVETDSPYLAPQPWRGKVNEPSYLAATLERLAQLHGLTPEETARFTWRNTLAAYSLDGKGLNAAKMGESESSGADLSSATKTNHDSDQPKSGRD